MPLTKHQRILKLKGDAAAYVADMDSFQKDLEAAGEAGLLDIPEGGQRAQALSFREDAIYREARSLGVTGAIFMWAVDQRATGPLSPNGALRTTSADFLAERRAD